MIISKKYMSIFTLTIVLSYTSTGVVSLPQKAGAAVVVQTSTPNPTAIPSQSPTIANIPAIGSTAIANSNNNTNNIIIGVVVGVGGFLIILAVLSFIFR